MILLAVFWRGRMKSALTLKEDFPIFAVVVLFHLSDVLFTLAGGFHEVLWLILLTSAVHFVLLGLIYNAGRKVKMPQEGYLFEP